MSRNLIHYSLERLDNLPTRGKLCDSVNTSLEVKRNKNYHYRYAYKYKLADRILNGSVGKNASEVYHKVKPLVKDYSTRWDGAGWWRSNTTLNSCSRRSNYGIYIDENNIIRYKPHFYTKRFRLIPSRKKQYEKLSAERKETRDRNKFLSEENKFASDLVKSNAKAKYFRSLLINKEKRESIIKSPKPEYPSPQHQVWYQVIGKKLVDKTPAQFQKDIDHYKMSLENWWNRKVLALRELDELYIEIESFRNKDFKNFYQSYEYINSVKKDCHHYAQP